MKIVRTAATATLALTTAVALAACTPPHENDSDQPFQDNQTGVSSPAIQGGESSSSSEASESADAETAVETATEDATAGESMGGAEAAGTQGEAELPAQNNTRATTATVGQ